VFTLGQNPHGVATSLRAVSKVPYFRTKAAECDKLADKASDPEAKRNLREAAENWRIMAYQADRLGW
jgi:hypothetical protein